MLHGFNLLRVRPVASLIRWKGFPGIFQVAVLCVYVALAVFGWGYYTPEGVNAKLYAKTNLVNLVIWGLWWPAIVWVTFLLGRAWCMVCPLELLSSQASKLATKLRLAQRPRGGWLARGSLVILVFALLQMLVPGIQIHRVPHYTSLFLIVSLTLAFAVGLFFKDRAFCRGFCPIALLLSAYGRGGILAVRPSASGCGVTARACPSLLNPSRLNTSKDCLVCGDCIKAGSAGEMELVVRPLYSKEDAREALPSWPLTIFVVIVSGFVTYELTGVWKAAGSLFLWAPAQVSASGWVQGAWTILVWPVLLWLLLGSVTLLTSGANNLGEAWRRLALPAAVVVATGQMAKGLEKFTSWIGFLPYAWSEPTGTQTAIKMNAKLMPQPAAWLTPAALSVCSMLLVAFGIWLALREARLADPDNGRRRYVSILLLGGLYFLLVLGWSGWIK